MPVFGSLMSKISELSLSDLNHELGKAKESLMYGSSQYVQNFRSDAATMGSMIRSESTRFGDYMDKFKKPKMPKSTSLPVIQDKENIGGLPLGNGNISHKYQYRSRTIGSNFSPTLSPSDLLEDSVVAKFIKVVGEEEDIREEKISDTRKKEKRRPTVRTREDILKKLTDFGEGDEDNTDSEDNIPKKDDLEICFINERAFDDCCAGGDEGDSIDNEALSDKDNGHNDEELSASINSSVHSSSMQAENSDDFAREPPAGDAMRSYELEKKRIKEAACLALAQCQQIARSQALQEKQQSRASMGKKIKEIIGMDYAEINTQHLRDMNITSLQVILNDMTESIEVYNKELVQLLISKDELQIEQESMLMDIGDIMQKN
eukprot:TRINITY_DN6439_c0_g1_i1.p1 TRINITY_DN6439_c0_g1~~TRINITY_DN6439_c0_g1_i1.p1  ORF type:complete len:376 (+),score=85.72 TRINITY_DN6439_c0_g1_i1:145-1272(+)